MYQLTKSGTQCGDQYRQVARVKTAALWIEHSALFLTVCVFWGLVLFVALTTALR
jgi:hypothetical protein